MGNDRVKGLFERAQLDLLSIFAGQASLILQNAMLLNALRADKEKLSNELKDKRFGEIIGVCGSMMEVFRKLQKVATTDISPGQQLMATDFGPAGASVANQLASNQRAVVVPLGSPQEVGGQIAAGSHVDVWIALSGQGANGAIARAF